MRPSETQRAYYTRTASEYDRMHVTAGDEHYRALQHTSSLMKMLGMSSVLDVGCGTGRGVGFFRQQGMHAAGIEPVEALVEQAVQRHGVPPASLLCGSGEALPLPDGSFDAVCEFGVLHHVPRPDRVVREMMRVARKGVFLSDANRFGQGPMPERWAKLLLCRLGLWGLVTRARTRGKGYFVSEEDGLFYSYSVFDQYALLASWADRVLLIPTAADVSRSPAWLSPLLTSGHVLLCALKDGGAP